MEPIPHPEALALYRRLRGDLLSAAHHHRRAARPEGHRTDVHRTHLAVCRHQLTALRQAWRGTREASRWNAYVRDRTPRDQRAASNSAPGALRPGVGT